MKRLLFTLGVLTVSLFARFEAKPSQSCEAYNNLKHTENTHHVVLQANQSYTVLQKHKGQYLILLKGESPAQRWVDGGCFDNAAPEAAVSQEEHTHSADAPAQTHNLLALSWHNAFCETHRYKKECKVSLFSRLKESRFVLHGLWPQPRQNVYCGVDERIVSLDERKQWSALPQVPLDQATRDELETYMPGAASGLDRHEWYKHGSCYNADAQTYYTDAIKLIKQFNDSKVSAFFRNNEGKYITLAQVRYVFDRSFGMGTGARVEMQCKGKLVTELWLHLGSGSDDLGELLKKGKTVNSYCRGGIVDRAGY